MSVFKLLLFKGIFDICRGSWNRTVANGETVFLSLTAFLLMFFQIPHSRHYSPEYLQILQRKPQKTPPNTIKLTTCIQFHRQGNKQLSRWERIVSQEALFFHKHNSLSPCHMQNTDPDKCSYSCCPVLGREARN